MGWHRGTQRPFGGVPEDDRPTRAYPTSAKGDPRLPHRGERPAATRDPSYWSWALLGLAAPYALAALLYPLASVTTGALVVPILAWLGHFLVALGSLLGLGASISGPPGGAFAWYFGHQLGDAVEPAQALTAAVAFVVARLVIGRVAAGGGRLPDASHPQRGFAAGSRTALLLAFLIGIWWLGATLIGAS